MKIMISNQSSIAIDQERIKSLAKKILFGEGFGKAEISIALVDDDEIKRLNARYRKKDEVTDVLAFPHDGIGLEGTGIPFIGEVVISLPKVKEQATTSFANETDRVLVHGILHLLGFDHEMSRLEKIRMKKREEFYLRLPP